MCNSRRKTYWYKIEASYRTYDPTLNPMNLTYTHMRNSESDLHSQIGSNYDFRK